MAKYPKLYQILQITHPHILLLDHYLWSCTQILLVRLRCCIQMPCNPSTISEVTYIPLAPIWSCTQKSLAPIWSWHQIHLAPIWSCTHKSLSPIWSWPQIPLAPIWSCTHIHIAPSEAAHNTLSPHLKLHTHTISPHLKLTTNTLRLLLILHTNTFSPRFKYKGVSLPSEAAHKYLQSPSTTSEDAHTDQGIHDSLWKQKYVGQWFCSYSACLFIVIVMTSLDIWHRLLVICMTARTVRGSIKHALPISLSRSLHICDI